MGRLKVLLADDHRTFADAVAMRLAAEADIDVLGVTTFGDDGTAHLAVADVLVTEIEVVGQDALDIAASGRDRNPGLRVIVLTSREDTDIALHSLRNGATSFLTKDTTFEELVVAIQGSVRDETWVSPRVLTRILRQLLAAPTPLTSSEEQLLPLTARERDVLACMVAGMNRSAIADALFVSPNTVRTHTQRILRKLDVHSSLEAVAIALRARVRPHGGSPRSGPR